MRYATLLLVASSGCFLDFSPDHSHDYGSPDDVTTQPGEYTTYSVRDDCAVGDYVVIGGGSVPLIDRTNIANAGEALEAELEKDSDAYVFYGSDIEEEVCTPGVLGIEVELDDWHEVDGMIAKTGAWLDAHDLALEVAISVQVPAIPVSQ